MKLWSFSNEEQFCEYCNTNFIVCLVNLIQTLSLNINTYITILFERTVGLRRSQLYEMVFDDAGDEQIDGKNGGKIDGVRSVHVGRDVVFRVDHNVACCGVRVGHNVACHDVHVGRDEVWYDIQVCRSVACYGVRVDHNKVWYDDQVEHDEVWYGAVLHDVHVRGVVFHGAYDVHDVVCHGVYGVQDMVF